MHFSDPTQRPKYDPETFRVMQATKARSVLLLVIDGKKGDGLAFKVRSSGNPADDAEQLRVMARALQLVAADLLAAADAQHIGDFFDHVPVPDKEPA